MSEGAVAAAYDARAAEYIALLGDVRQMADADRELIARWRDQTTGSLLDAGCGPGHWADLLRGGRREVVGIDVSAEMIASARSRFPGARFERASLGALPFADASFGGILAWYSLIHLPPEEIPTALRGLARVLAPGGSLLIGYFPGKEIESFDHAVHAAYLWPEAALTASLEAAGFAVAERHTRERTASEQSRRPHGSLVAVLDRPAA